MIALFAITNRGLEAVCAEEMRRIPGLEVTQVSYRRVSAACSGELTGLLALRTVDDVFLDLATWDALAPQRSELAHLTLLAAQLELAPALAAAAQLRAFSPSPAFSVTANFVGKRNYSVPEIKEAVAGGIRAATGWPYAQEDESEVNIRLFIEHQRAYVGMRLAANSLHRRPYKQANLPGSLKPPIAAAMLQIGELHPAQTLLDPFCGAGTIPIEAALADARALGGDNDPAALQAARANASAAGLQLPLADWDALRLPLDRRSMARVVTNLPWGLQVALGGDIPAFYRQACAEIERVLAAGGQAVILTNLPHLLSFDHLTLVSQTEISLYGQLPVIARFAAT